MIKSPAATQVELAEQVARQYHVGQVDKSDRPYIEHVEAVASSEHVVTDEQRQTAWLHDVVEDTEVTLEDLTTLGFTAPVVTAVGLLTRQDGQTRREYIAAIIENPIARAVKKADNRHNHSRLGNIPEGATHDRLSVKYNGEWVWLTEGM